jgi:HupE / UreJ protein
MNAHLSFLRRLATVLLVPLVLLVSAPQAFAHKSSDAYLQVSEPTGLDLPRSAQGAFQLKFSIALRDVDAKLESLDQNNDRQLTWLEVRGAMPLIESWVSEGFSILCADVRKTVSWAFESLEERSDGAYVRLQVLETCPEKTKLAVQYELMKDIDSGHRLLVSGALGGEAIATVIAPQAVALKLTSGRAAATATDDGQQDSGSQQSATFRRFFTEGFWHLSLGFDHLAFLLVLVLPVSLTRSGLMGLLGTVTTFTLGHSITLGLATFGWVASPNWVEPAITLSIALTALLNLFSGSWLGTQFGRKLNTRWVALIFGLIHGLGFSGAMTEAGVDRSLLLWALGGFNLGLEAAQLLAIMVWLGLCFGVLRWTKYKSEDWPMVVRGGSTALLLVALIWTAQRVL